MVAEERPFVDGEDRKDAAEEGRRRAFEVEVDPPGVAAVLRSGLDAFVESLEDVDTVLARVVAATGAVGTLGFTGVVRESDDAAASGLRCGLAGGLEGTAGTAGLVVVGLVEMDGAVVDLTEAATERVDVVDTPEVVRVRGGMVVFAAGSLGTGVVGDGTGALRRVDADDRTEDTEAGRGGGVGLAWADARGVLDEADGAGEVTGVDREDTLWRDEVDAKDDVDARDAIADRRGAVGFSTAADVDLRSVGTGVREEDDAIDPPREGARGNVAVDVDDRRGVATEDVFDATVAREVTVDLDATDARLVVDIRLETLTESLSRPVAFRLRIVDRSEDASSVATRDRDVELDKRGGARVGPVGPTGVTKSSSSG